jgi:trimeric autotransporter adhesin
MKLPSRGHWMVCAALTLLYTVVLNSGCNDAKLSQPNAQPSLVSISPSSATSGGAAFSLTVTGANFVSSSTVNWNGTARASTFVSSTQMTAAITAADIAAAGTVPVTVNTPAPGGGTSSAVQFTVAAATNPVPSISSLSPGSATAGDTPFTLTVNGTNFVNTSTVKWNGSGRTTTFVSTTQIAASISATDVLTAGTAQVTVTNPAPGGGTSAATAFAVNAAVNPVPTIINISPAGTTAGGAAFTLTVNGTNFISTSVVQWNTSARPTAFVNNTQLTAQIPAGDLATAGTPSVTVTNPAPGGGTSNGVTFTVSAGAQTVGIVQQGSVNTAGDSGNQNSFNPALSEDGRYLAFASLSTNLGTSDTNNATDIFLHDTCRGASAPSPCASSTIRVSVDSAGQQLANGATADPGNFISSDGRFVVFNAQIGDIVANSALPANTVETFLRDTCMGQSSNCTPSTTMVSVDNSAAPANTGVFKSFISRNGRIVVFISGSSNLLSNVPAMEVFARDTCFGAPAECTPSTFLVSESAGGAAANISVNNLAVNSDGRYVAFETAASNLVTNDTNNAQDIFVRDTCVGAPAGCTPTTTLVSATQAGGVPIGQVTFGTHYPSLSGDGRYVLFESDMPGLVSANIGGNPQIFLRDTCAGTTGACTPATTLISADSNGVPGNSDSFANGFALLSETGRYVAFTSLATNLLAGTTGGQSYVKDTCMGTSTACTQKLTVVSVDAQGNPDNASSNGLGSDGVPVISEDGKYAVLAKFDRASNAIQLFLALTSY